MTSREHAPRLDGSSRVVKEQKPPSKRKAGKTVSSRVQHRGNRHGRSEPARQAILHAAYNLLVEKGFAGVTIEGIAAKAGVGKQTIYRWWTSKTDVLMDAFLEDAAEHLVAPDSADLRKDLRRHLRNCAGFFSKKDAGAVFRALIGEAQHDAKLAERLRSQYLREQRIRDLVPLQRAMARGELRPNLDLEMAADQLMGPIYHRILVTGAPVTARFTDFLVDSFLVSSVE